MTRDERKADYQAYRKAAQNHFGSGPLTQPFDVTVPHHANVEMLEDGAYVDAVIWVPRSTMESAR